MKVIIFTRPDGGVSVVNPAPEFMAKFNNETEGLAAIQAKSIPADATDIETIDKTLLPDREFRNAWVHSTGPAPVTVDMSKAREIQTERINKAKRVLARGLLEREMLGENIITEKATLVAIDMAQAINAAQTPRTLSNVWPPGLVRP